MLFFCVCFFHFLPLVFIRLNYVYRLNISEKQGFGTYRISVFISFDSGIQVIRYVPCQSGFRHGAYEGLLFGRFQVS